MVAATCDADRIRIAIALTSLKFKPHTQSFQSCALDLCAKFPPSRPLTGERSWRDHAHDLEQKLADLRAKYQDEHLQLVALSAAPELSEAPAKKKVKKKLSDTGSKNELEAILDGSNDSSGILKLPGPRSLFSTFQTFHRLTRVLDDENTIRPALVTAARCALEAIGDVLGTTLPPRCSLRSPREALYTITALLTHLLATLLPLLITKLPKRRVLPHGSSTDPTADIDNFLGVLATSVCLPIIRAFTPSTYSYFVGVFSVNKKNPERKKPIPIDTRQDTLSLLRKVLSMLDDYSFHASVAGVKEGFALEAVRELERIFPDAGRMDPLNLVYDNRIGALAKKDALCYLCNVLHLVFRSKLPTATRIPKWPDGYSTDGGLGRKGILDSLSGLLRRSNTLLALGARPWDSPKGKYEVSQLGADSRATDRDIQNTAEMIGKTRGVHCIDEVGHQLLLAVVEKAWEYWFGASDSSKDT